MQAVSSAYKQSMKSTLRERGYIMLSFGLINQEAQTSATFEAEDCTYFSDSSKLFKKGTDKVEYATLEEKFTRVDGSMLMLPRKNSTNVFYNTGLISDKLLSEARYSLTINLNIRPTDFKGITIDFGDNYPTDFDIISDTGQTVRFRDNTLGKFTTEEVFENTSKLTMIFYKMKNPQSRLRIYSIQFGYGLVYYNDAVINSSLESLLSPISATVPQIDFTVELNNYDKYFNVDNPNSAINFLETGQEMDIYYGYQLPDSEEIEWIKGNHLLCATWESDDYTAKIRCQDVLRNMDTEFYKGTFNSTNRSYYSLAVEILKEAEITNYYIDPYLAGLYTKNPIPRVTYKEALQIIANACRCILTQSRDGVLQIIPNFDRSGMDEPDFKMEKRDMISSPKAIKQEIVKEITVPCYSYQMGNPQESLINEEVTVMAGEERTFLLGAASYDYFATLDEVEGNVIILASGSYYVTVRFDVTGTFQFKVKGYRYKIVEQYATVKLHERGKSIKWENPLISSMTMARNLADWIADYYSSGVEYEYKTRGNPELDVNDIIYQENEFHDNMRVTVSRTTINFDQAFSGSVTARRVED